MAGGGNGAALTPAMTGAAFAAALRPLLPKPRPARIAVAVSGGADSMALAVLAAGWAAKHGVALTAFTVDHGLRPEAAREARQVAAWLKAAGIAHRILRWQPAVRPQANIQAAARAARYDLLQTACARAKIGHLLLAHHRDDQAETLLLRSLRGSGVDGLAAMAPARQLDDGLVILRPLLDIPKARLEATLRRRGQDWIEDPSNRDDGFARVRVRQALDHLAGGDAAARAEITAHLAQTAANMARARTALAAAAHDLLRAAIVVAPAGYALLDPAPLATAGEETALRALARLLAAIGGQPLPPRLDRLQRLLTQITARHPMPQTLHRCRLLPQSDGRLLVCREARHLPPPLPLKPGMDLLWDGRFRVRCAARIPAGLVLAPLAGRSDPAGTALPAPVRATLPALWRGKELLAVPGQAGMPGGIAVTFQPIVAGTGIFAAETGTEIA